MFWFEVQLELVMRLSPQGSEVGQAFGGGGALHLPAGCLCVPVLGCSGCGGGHSVPLSAVVALGGPETMSRLQVRAGGSGWAGSQELKQPQGGGHPPPTSCDELCLSHGLFASCLG